MTKSIRDAMQKAGVSTIPTPHRPSRRAIARVTNPLPAPTECPHCASGVEISCNSVVYGIAYGDYPWIYKCTNDECGSYVGMHPFTNIPLGTLATRAIRTARKRAKEAFNNSWQARGLTRSQAYEWLAEQLQIPLAECHIGWSDIAQCNRIIEASRKIYTHKS